MAQKYLYGIIRAEGPVTFGASAFPFKPQPVYTVAHAGLAGVVSDYPGEVFASLTKEDQFRSLLAHQVVIERVMQEHTVLPVKFGTLVAEDEEVRLLLGQGGSKFNQALAQIEGKVEMEVVATWELKRVLEDIGREEEVVQLRQSIAHKPAGEARALQVQAGRWVQERLDKQREEYREQIGAWLKEVALEAQPNALLGDEMVMNVACLIHKAREKDFDQRLRGLNEHYHDLLQFRILGPLPPYSFSTVEVTRPRLEGVEAARQLLGLGVQVSLVEVKKAYRRLAARSHPDSCPGDESAQGRFIRLREASSLLLSYCQGQGEGRSSVSLASEDVSQTFLIRVKRPAADGGLKPCQW